MNHEDLLNRRWTQMNVNEEEMIQSAPLRFFIRLSSFHFFSYLRSSAFICG